MSGEPDRVASQWLSDRLDSPDKRKATSNMTYELTKQPLTIKKTTFPNSVAFAPIQTNYATEDGEATDRLIRFHQRIAKSAVGLSIVGATGVSPTSKLGPRALCLYADRHIASVRKLFDAIREAGSVPPSRSTTEVAL